jgi:2-polyprenyl-6-methoxyphenol hydroxylase-like FAD-dependent oxidoreductase
VGHGVAFFLSSSFIMALQTTLTTKCCIVGGGPAGMMLGFLLARAGIEVIVLEKHADFFRDFRGDTIHPSTMQIMHELGLLDDFLKVPHQEVKQIGAVFNNILIQIADFTHLDVAKPVLGLMPQWDFLKFVQKHASKYPGFKLIMNANVTDIIKENGRITGVKVEANDGLKEIYASLVVGTDGRRSTVREKAALNVIQSGVPIDILWFRLSRQESDPEQTVGRFDNGRIMILINREEYWQCGYIIDKGGYAKIQEKGITVFRETLTQLSPFLSNRVEELKSWDDVKLLTVDIDHLEKWHTEGLLCIGDAAHAMSPVGGVGINLAIQDAVAAANILYKPLQQNVVISEGTLASIQKRREFPTKIIQKLQITIQNGISSRREPDNKDKKPPLVFRLLTIFPILRRIPARVIGMGIRPEHVKTPEVK